jgi:hypothetical protein
MSFVQPFSLPALVTLAPVLHSCLSCHHWMVHIKPAHLRSHYQGTQPHPTAAIKELPTAWSRLLFDELMRLQSLNRQRNSAFHYPTSTKLVDVMVKVQACDLTAFNSNFSETIYILTFICVFLGPSRKIQG